MGKRLELRKFRAGLDLTQEEMATRMGIGRNAYSDVESGSRNGTMAFWVKLQKTFNIPDERMWGFINEKNAQDGAGQIRQEN